MGNPKRGRVVAYGRGRLHESFLLQSLSHGSNGFHKGFRKLLSQPEPVAFESQVARRASTVYLPRFMKTRLANILLFPSTSPVLACLLCCLLMSVFLLFCA